MQRPPHLQNVDPSQLFRDPNYNPNASNKISDQEIQARQNAYQNFMPAQPPPQVQNFADLNNAKNFQLQNFKADIDALKHKLNELEKRYAQLTAPTPAHQQQQPLQTGPVQIPQRPPQMQQPQMQQPVQMQPPAQQPPQQPFFQPPPQGLQPPQGGFQPFRPGGQ